MRLTNTTDIPNSVIMDVVRFVRPPSISRFRVTVTNKTGRAFGGWGGSHGVMLRINPKAKYPFRLWTYQYGQLRGRRYYIASQLEMLIYLAAHELMHTRQGKKGGLRGRVWGARGRYSEIECDSYAIAKLREWRRIWLS